MVHEPRETKEHEVKLVGGLFLPIEGSLDDRERTWLTDTLMAEIKHNPLARCEVGYDGSIRFFAEEIGENDCLPMPIAFLTPERLYEIVRAVIARLLDRSLPEFVPFPEPATQPVEAVQQGSKRFGERLMGLLPFGSSGKAEVHTKDREGGIHRQRKEHDTNQLRSLAQSLEPFRGELTQRIRERAVASGEQEPGHEKWKTVRKVEVAPGARRDVRMNLHPSRVEATEDGARISAALSSDFNLSGFVPKGSTLALKYGLEGLVCTVTDEGAIEIRVVQGGATLQVPESAE